MRVMPERVSQAHRPSFGSSLQRRPHRPESSTVHHLPSAASRSLFRIDPGKRIELFGGYSAESGDVWILEVGTAAAESNCFSSSTFQPPAVNLLPSCLAYPPRIYSQCYGPAEPRLYNSAIIPVKPGAVPVNAIAAPYLRRAIQGND